MSAEQRIRLTETDGWHTALVDQRHDPSHAWHGLWSTGACLSETAARSVAERWLAVFRETGSWRAATEAVGR